MKSYSLSTTIALLGTMVAFTSAVPATSAKRKLLHNVQMLETDEGGLIASLFENAKTPRDGGLLTKAEEEPTPSLAGAVNDAAAAESRLRGATTDNAPLYNKNGYGKGTGKGGYGKDCKSKSDKKEKSKGKGKGDKSEGKGKAAKSKSGGKGIFGKGSTKSPSESPSASPSISPSPSASPTESQSPTVTESESPTAEWCKEDEWDPVDWHPSPHHTKHPTPPPTSSAQPTDAPTFTPQPTVSPAPSESPTISHEPSSSSAPSDSPSISPRPTVTASPTGDPISFSSGGKSFCQLLDAAYTNSGSEIEIWNPDLNKGLEKQATAAVASSIKTPVPVANTALYNVEVTMKVFQDKVSNISVIELDIDKAITPPVALEVAGCPGRARTIAEEYYYENVIARRLQSDNDSTLSVVKKWSCDDKSNCNDDENECDVTCGTEINYQGELKAKQFEDRLYWSLKEYFSMMDDVTDWYVVQTLDDDISIEEIEKGGDANGINDLDINQNAQRGARAAPFIGTATGLLAVLLLSVLFVRRRKHYEEEEVSHLKLEDDFEDDTFYSGSDGARNYSPRDTHIVGENDSVISHWTGYTGRNHPNVEVPYQRSGLMKDGLSPDVHQCSSATCELCAIDRERGVKFVKTGNTSLPTRSESIPSNASREYAVNDTVLL